MARVLAKKNIAKAIVLAGDEPAEKAQDKLPDGHMRLYSYFKPGLSKLYVLTLRCILTGRNRGGVVWNRSEVSCPSHFRTKY